MTQWGSRISQRGCTNHEDVPTYYLAKLENMKVKEIELIVPPLPAHEFDKLQNHIHDTPDCVTGNYWKTGVNGV